MMFSKRFWLAVIAMTALAAPVRAQLAPAPNAEAVVTAPTIAMLEMRSAILGETRLIDVWTPDSYASGDQSYHLLLVLDGDYLFEHARTASDYLAQQGAAPETIVVGLRTPDRVRDYTPESMPIPAPQRRGEAYARHLARELLPELARRYRLGRSVTIMGHSQSTILAAHVAAEFPDAVNGAVLLDAPMQAGEFWIDRELRRAVQQRRDRPLRLQAIEARFAWTDEQWRAFTVLVPASWRVERTRLEHETHTSMLMLGAYLGLRSLYADYRSDSRDARVQLTHHDNLPAFYGPPTQPTSDLLRWATEDYWIADDEPNARATLARWERAYPNAFMMDRLRTQIGLMRANPLPKRLDALLAEPRATGAELAPFLGEWRGEIRFSHGVNDQMVLRVVDGGGQLRIGSGEVRELDYLRVENGRLLFGEMNQIRPRGLLLYQGALRGDILSGTMDWGGIRFDHPPSGDRPPTFEIRRVR